MNKEDYIKIAEDKFRKEARDLVLKQINYFYDIKDIMIAKSTYKVGELVKLKKCSLLHGTYRNIEGLIDIVSNGLIASYFTKGRLSKYPSSVGVWNIKEECNLIDYINYYSGGTIKYNGLLVNNEYSKDYKSEIIPYSKMNNLNKYILDNPCRMWTMEQTKEARFMPSLIQDKVEIGIIFNGDNKYTKELLNGDILNPNNVDDNLVCSFINKDYDIESFIKNRHNKDDFFTDRESAILFGLPSNLIEGILVGRTYENDKDMLDKIKNLLPNCYICNLDGIVIVENS